MFNGVCWLHCAASKIHEFCRRSNIHDHVGTNLKIWKIVYQIWKSKDQNRLCSVLKGPDKWGPLQWWKNTQYYIGCPWCFHGSIISVYYVSSAAERCFPDSSTHIAVPTNAHVTHSLWSVQCPNFTSYSLMLLNFYWLLFKKSLNLLTFISLYLLTTAFL